MIKATYKKHILNFKNLVRTSRGTIESKETWFIILEEDNKIGVGESAIFRGLSIDDVDDYEEKLKWVCKEINLGLGVLISELHGFPSIQFGLEQAFLSLKSSNKFVLFPSKFTEGKDIIPINGLVWMGNKDYMKSQIKDILKSGFKCIKIKIGTVDFDTEIELLKDIRKEYSEKEIEIRTDANGFFTPKNALQKLQRLYDLKVHSIEQPIKPGQTQEMANLCEKSPLPIALDEELIYCLSDDKKKSMLYTIKPQYIILKPSLIGGFKGSKEWIMLAEENNCNWWVTSALESNVGLNAISQFTYILQNNLTQGLGTGNLFTNNFHSPLKVKNGTLQYQPKNHWKFNL